MRKYIIISLMAVASVFATSCSGFLETAPTSDVSDSQVFTSVKGAQAALNGCYNYFNFGASYDGGRGDDNGYITHLMTIESRGEDLICDGGWWNFDYQYLPSYNMANSWKNYQLWAYYYTLINNLNSIITFTPDIDGDDNEKNAVLGQAHAMRGWSYFMLAQFFQQTYSSATKNNLPGVPIYTEPTTSSTEGKPRGTIQETFQQIVTDLTAAEGELQSFNRGSKHHIDLSVTQGMLAHVYLVMNEWDKAKEYAAKARNGYPMTSNADWTEGFNNINTGSWLWGVTQDSENHWLNNGDYAPFGEWANKIMRGSHDAHWSFNGFWLPEDFVAYFEEGDIRSNCLIYGTKGWTSSKFYDVINCTDHGHASDPELYATLSKLFSSREDYQAEMKKAKNEEERMSKTFGFLQATFSGREDRRGNFVYMRTEDLLLVEAEAAARLGEFDYAGELLRSLQTLRGAKTSTSIGDDLIEEILLERRKELYGEGHASFDLIRAHKGLKRGGDHSAHTGAKKLPAGSWLMIYQIPLTEINNNPNIDSSDQNPYDTTLENL